MAMPARRCRATATPCSAGARRRSSGRTSRRAPRCADAPAGDAHARSAASVGVDARRQHGRRRCPALTRTASPSTRPSSRHELARQADATGGRASAVSCSAGARRTSGRSRRSARRRCARARRAVGAARGQRVGRSARRRGEPARRSSATSPSASARTSSDGLERRSRRPSRLPSTRSTFHAGRASPSGLTTPWKLCTRPSALTKVPEVSVNGAIGSSTSATSTPASLERRQRDDHLGAGRARRAPRAGSAASSAGSTLSSRQAFSGASAPSICAGVQAARGRAARRRAARRRCWPPRRGSRRSRRSARRSSCASAEQLRGLRVLRGGVAEQHRLALAAEQRRGDRLRLVVGFAPSAGAATPLAAATAAAIVGQRLRPALGAAVMLGGHRHQPVVVQRVHARRPCAPLLGRLAQALREQRMVLAQERADDERRAAARTATAIERAEPAASPRAAAFAKSAWRRRWSMFSLPRPRTSLASRCSSSTRAVRRRRARRCSAAPCSAVICVRPRAT